LIEVVKEYFIVTMIAKKKHCRNIKSAVQREILPGLFKLSFSAALLLTQLAPAEFYLFLYLRGPFFPPNSNELVNCRFYSPPIQNR
jgi:hypothetical protein